MKFKLLSGRHIENGAGYSKGAIVESDKDLVKAFGPLKFIAVQPTSSRRTKSAKPAAAPVLEAKHYGNKNWGVIIKATGQKINDGWLTRGEAEDIANA